jgi:hypothetical protein
MPKIDFKKTFKDLYSASPKEIQLVRVPRLQFLMADGEGDPNEVPAFGEAIEALYGIAYTLKFALKKEDPELDYVVPPLEGLWWADDFQAFSPERMDKNAWKWTLVILQPETVTQEQVSKAKDQVFGRKGLPGVSRVYFAAHEEGLSVQLLHIGPYANEGETIEKLHDFMRKHGFAFNGKHHEIYLSDPRRTEPEKLKTILRQPVRTA